MHMTMSVAVYAGMDHHLHLLQRGTVLHAENCHDVDGQHKYADEVWCSLLDPDNSARLR